MGQTELAGLTRLFSQYGSEGKVTLKNLRLRQKKSEMRIEFTDENQ